MTMEVYAHDIRTQPTPCRNGAVDCLYGDIAHEACTVLSTETATNHVDNLLYRGVFACMQQRDDALDRLGQALTLCHTLGQMMHTEHDGDFAECLLCAGLKTKIADLRGRDQRQPQEKI